MVLCILDFIYNYIPYIKDLILYLNYLYGLIYCNLDTDYQIMIIYTLQIIKALLTIRMPLEINSEVNMDYVEAVPLSMLRRVDSNHRPQGYEPCKLPSAPRRYIKT